MGVLAISGGGDIALIIDRSSMLPDWELAQIRTDLEKTMPDRCNVYRMAGEQDDYGGGYTYATDPVLENVPVYVNPTSSDDPELAARQVGLGKLTLSFPYGTDIQVGDRVLVQGETVVIDRVLDPESWDALLRAGGSTLEGEANA